MNVNKTVLVLDGETRAALAVVRSLGRVGLKVVVASELPLSLAGSSRYCEKTFRYSSPSENTETFAFGIRDLIIKEKIDVLIPVTDLTTYAILEKRSQFEDITALPLVSFKTYWEASNKISLLNTAKTLGIPIPSTIFIEPTSDQSVKQLSNVKFPVILKPRASILANGNTMKKTSVRFAGNYEELMQIISTDKSFTAPYMLQEVIKGDGIGIFVFCINGEIVNVFSHRRVREKPPYGGISVVCESTLPDLSALDSSKKLLKALNWSGVAMVEFKCDSSRNNIPVLMEINARLWGSLQLAIDSGFDFPLYLYCLSQNIDISRKNILKKSRNRWLLGDIDHLLIRLKTPSDSIRYPQRLIDKIGAVFIFFLEFFRGSKIEELRYSDIGPFWHSLKLWVKNH